MGAIFFQHGPIPPDALVGYYDLSIVAVSYIMAVLASFVALDTAEKLRRESIFSWVLLFIGAVAMGGGIFTMHFIGMQAFILPMPMSYDAFLTYLSLLIPIVASGVALYFVRNQKSERNLIIIGGTIFGIAIVSMHYTGMSAMVDMQIYYWPGLFFLSILIALVASMAALWMMLQSHKGSRLFRIGFKIISALIMGAAISGMHYTGMIAGVYIPTDTHTISLHTAPYIISRDSLTLLIAYIASFIMILALLYNSYRQYIFVKILMGYGIILLMLIPIVFLNRENLDNTKNYFKEISEANQHRNELVQIRNTLAETIFNVIPLDEKIEIEQTKKDLSNLSKTIKQLKKSSDRQIFQPSIDEAQILTTKVFDLIQRNASVEDLTLERNKLVLFLKDFLIQVTDRLTVEQKSIDSLVERGQDHSIRTSRAIFWMFIPVILIALLISIFLSFQIAKPLTELVRLAKRISEGDLDVQGGVFPKDEVGRLGKSFDIMVMKLKRSINAKSNFIAYMSHNLRTPLNAIMGFTDMLLMKIPGPLNEKQEKQLSIISRCSSHLLNLIKQLLDFSIFETRNIAPRLETIKVNQFLNDILQEMKPLALNKGLTLQFIPLEKELSIEADKKLFWQVMTNTVDNAIKFTPTGSVTVLEKIIEESGRKFLEIHIKDTGIGIKKENLHKIFVAFSPRIAQVENLEHTGIGLYISRKFCEVQGWRLYCESEFGVGSTFIVKIPLD